MQFARLTHKIDSQTMSRSLLLQQVEIPRSPLATMRGA